MTSGSLLAVEPWNGNAPHGCVHALLPVFPRRGIVGSCRVRDRFHVHEHQVQRLGTGNSLSFPVLPHEAERGFVRRST